MRISTVIILTLTLIMFAANSILCRLALAGEGMGPVEFALLRLGSGAMVLLPILLIGLRRGKQEGGNDWGKGYLSFKLANYWQGISLFGYAIFFSLAYVELEAATGALILFPTVQISMVGYSIMKGNRLTLMEWTGFLLSFGGLIYLMAPGVTAPPLVGTIMMILSGVSWSAYSLLGTNQSRPILATARNFLFCWPFLIFLLGITLIGAINDVPPLFTTNAVLLSILSGGVASGIGYILWYVSLARISTTQASVAQLAVPVIAASGGILFLGEQLTLRLMVASLVILGGVTITIFGRKRKEG